MKKIFTLFAAVVCGMALNAKTIYLTPGVWADADAVIFAHSWTGTNGNEQDLQLTSAGSGILSVEVPDGNEKIIFVRMPAGSTSLNWDTKWDKTDDLVIPSDKNMYVITDWHDGHWEAYGDVPGPGDDPGDGELEESGEGHEFSLMGSIGGNWNIEVPMAEYTFDERGRWTGVLGSHPDKEHISYVVIIDEEGNQYKTKGWQGENATKVTLYWANGFEDSNVWQLPADQTLYLIMRKCTFKGSIEVERVDQATYEAYTIDWGTSTPGQQEAVENTVVKTHARKAIIDGRLVIIRGEKMFDATGRAL